MQHLQPLRRQLRVVASDFGLSNATNVVLGNDRIIALPKRKRADQLPNTIVVNQNRLAYYVIARVFQRTCSSDDAMIVRRAVLRRKSNNITDDDTQIGATQTRKKDKRTNGDKSQRTRRASETMSLNSATKSVTNALATRRLHRTFRCRVIESKKHGLTVLQARTKTTASSHLYRRRSDCEVLDDSTLFFFTPISHRSLKKAARKQTTRNCVGLLRVAVRRRLRRGGTENT